MWNKELIKKATFAKIVEVIQNDMRCLKRKDLMGISNIWLFVPSINARSERTRDRAKIISKRLGINHATYRKVCVKMRKLNRTLVN